MSKWNKKLIRLVISLNKEGKSFKEISLIVGKSQSSINKKLNRIGYKLKKYEGWNQDLIDKILLLIKEGKSAKEISLLINRSQCSIIRKFNRLGYSFGKNKGSNKKSKYEKIDWNFIQKNYDDGCGYVGLIKIFKLTPQAIIWAKKNKLLKLRTVLEGAKKARELGKGNKSNSDGIIKYRQLCEFKFNVYDYPDEFDLKLLKENGWYKAKNRGNNLNGVSKDHKYSVKEGFLNKVNPNLLSHPANCKLVLHKENSSKRSKCSITLEELQKNINIWNEKYRK